MFRSSSDGCGIALLPDAAVRGSPDLVRLALDVEPPSAPVYLAYHRDLRAIPRVRLVLDSLDAALRDGLR